jgi:hypothetical protein
VRAVRHTIRCLIAVAAVALVLAACSSDDDPVAKDASSTTTTTGAKARPVSATAAALEGPITVGTLSPFADPRPPELDTIDYVQEEFFAGGTATSYKAKGELTEDGRWDVTEDTTAPYKTRFVVRRPKDPSKFSGTVVVEWLNVSAVEAAPEWVYTRQAMVDDGAAWVGVSVQSLGVIGGDPLLQTGDARQASSNKGIKGSNPERYGSLEHPGDKYAFDIYSQIGAALRGSAASKALGGGKTKRLIATGESQSAAYMSGYINAFQPRTNVFDGFFVHSRGSAAAHPDGTRDIRGANVRHHFRDDLDVPVIAVETETDINLLRYGTARQPDNDKLRVWEVPGTAHAYFYLLNNEFTPCPAGINRGPSHYLTESGMASLMAWIEKGTEPPHGHRIKTTAPDSIDIVRDADGNALGGIRTPAVDVPAATLTGAAAPGAPVLCALFGGTKPFDKATLAERYGTKEKYLAQFDKALDAAVAKGFVRKADRPEFHGEAEAVQF